VIHRASLWPQKLPIATALTAQELCRLKVGVDHQQTMVIKIGHNYLILQVERYTPRRVELLPERSIEPVLVYELAIRVEQLNAVVPRVRNEYTRLAGHSHVPRIVEVMPGLAALLAELEYERSIRLEYLYPVIVLVSHDYSIQLIIIGNTSRPIELSCPSPVRAELAQELSMLIKHLHTIIRPIGDNDTARIVAADTPRPTELTIPIALTAAINTELNLSDVTIRPATFHIHTERTRVNVSAVHEYRHEVPTIRRWTVVDYIRAVLLILYVNAVQLLVCTLN